MSRKLEKIAFLTLLSTGKGSKGFSHDASRAHISNPKIHHLSLAKIDENLELPDKVRSSNFSDFHLQNFHTAGWSPGNPLGCQKFELE